MVEGADGWGGKISDEVGVVLLPVYCRHFSFVATI